MLIGPINSSDKRVIHFPGMTIRQVMVISFALRFFQTFRLDHLSYKSQGIRKTAPFQNLDC